MEELNQSSLFDTIVHKGSLKQKIFQNTSEAFKLLREVIYAKDKYYRENYGPVNRKVPFTITDEGEFELRVQFAGDILIFLMHTNVFEFSRSHEVMQTQYIRDDKERSYCGMISIYNFLADSFKYGRVNDIGYMVGRMFVNKDMCYFIEGKRELGMLYPNFGKEKVDIGTIDNVVISEAIDRIRESVFRGSGIAEPMKQNKIFTPLVVQMISVGEKAGMLDETLQKMSRYYDMEVENDTKRLALYIEPLLTVVLGAAVLFFALAIFLPMWDMTKFAKA